LPTSVGTRLFIYFYLFKTFCARQQVVKEQYFMIMCVLWQINNK